MQKPWSRQRSWYLEEKRRDQMQMLSFARGKGTEGGMVLLLGSLQPLSWELPPPVHSEIPLSIIFLLGPQPSSPPAPHSNLERLPIHPSGSSSNVNSSERLPWWSSPARPLSHTLLAFITKLELQENCHNAHSDITHSSCPPATPHHCS